MTLTSTEWGNLIEVVRSAASQHILPRFRNLEASDVSTKSSPTDLVTLADTEAEAAMTAALLAQWSDTVVVGEEAIAEDPSKLAAIGAATRVVILDPVDGTWNFAKGLALFGMIAAVVESGKTVAGMLYDPVLDDWIVGSEGERAFYTRPGAADRQLRTSSLTNPEQMSGYVPLGLLPREARGEVIRRTADFNRVSSLRCACHEYRMLAQGHVEFALSGPIPNAWDHAAGALIVERSGGVARMLDGSPYKPELTSGYVLTAASQEVWDICAERFAFLLA
ncbi:inositol monophosphatase family protein [Flavimaricola marinus]|uniref:Inositol-1-monophosphatase n=1 Tax=Flavimaricola marinus TaxID=1819565 RepID=A0A238LHA6_9RHOB|nr:inositol monophosphatase [Flavimaricola marinus]SMY08962.1 Inositol-1-monophosphatase [Flavimaricola marinus]